MFSFGVQQGGRSNIMDDKRRAINIPSNLFQIESSTTWSLIYDVAVRFFVTVMTSSMSPRKFPIRPLKLLNDAL